MQLVLTPELLIEAYRLGLFPMARERHSPYVQWICPERRGQLPIRDLHIPARLKKTLRAMKFEIRIDHDFKAVMEACAAERDNRPDTWINASIIKAYCDLHERGHAHSVECWTDGKLAGGVYGVRIGAAFFGESMFSFERDASKVALVHLAARLWKGGFTVFDTQFINDHLKQFDAYEISHAEYMKRLEPAVLENADFMLAGLSERDLLLEYLDLKRE